MQAPDLYTHFLRRLNATGIRYMITGGLAAMLRQNGELYPVR